MPTKVDEIGPRIYRLSTLAPDIGPAGFTFNQFLLDDEEPLLVRTGHRSMFPAVRDAIERVMSLERLRWIAFGHIESARASTDRIATSNSPTPKQGELS